jgi:hypothetical protein
MKQFFYILIIGIGFSFSSHGQFKNYCIYTDPNIIVINCGIEDRYKIAETVLNMIDRKAKVIVLDFIFFDKRPADSLFIRQLKSETPIIIPMGDKNDSSYFNLVNCFNGPRSINGNEIDHVKSLLPFVNLNGKLRDSFELLVLKHFDPKKYRIMRDYLMSFDLTKLEAKANIEFNGNSLSCFTSIDIKNLRALEAESIMDKIVFFGYFGKDSDRPLKKDKHKYAFKVRATKGKRRDYMYAALISVNVISNLIRKEIREEDLFRIK